MGLPIGLVVLIASLMAGAYFIGWWAGYQRKTDEYRAFRSRKTHPASRNLRIVQDSESA